MSSSNLRLVPSSSHAQTVSIASTSNSQGLHDTIQHGARNLAAEVGPKHALEARLAGWQETQQETQLQLSRNMFGIHMPIRTLMDQSLISKSPSPVNFGTSLTGAKPSNVHLDILMGRDEELDVADVLVDRATTTQQMDFHREMEKKLRMM
ncbi:hypothetical protein T439DRAFT_315444 [Meredithblackwellia eburnea MCA 4105]